MSPTTFRPPAGRRHHSGVRLLAVLLVALVAAAACARTPDTTLHPDAPSISYLPPRHPFRHATLYVDRNTAAARWQRAHDARWLDPITSQPQARWLNSPYDLAGVPGLVERAGRQRALAVLVTYYLPHRGCSWSEGAPDAAAYERWIGRLIVALGSAHTVIIMEPDAVPADCFDQQRASLLTRSVRRLTEAGQYVYLDAGHSRWRSSGDMAGRLLRAGIQYAEGFSVNVSNRRTTEESYRWGRELSDLVGGRDFVIDTSRNGLGPPPDQPGRDNEWCNPRQQALGSRPTTAPGRAGLDALLWIKAPGESDGPCGGETGYLFSPAQARHLIMQAPWVPRRYRRLAAGAASAPAAG